MAESVLRNLGRTKDRNMSGALGLARGKYVLATVHRPENTDHPERLHVIASAPAAGTIPRAPAHAPAACGGRHQRRPGGHVRLSDRVGYLDMLALQRDDAAIVTNSGGIQEEACMVGTPCVTVRRNTQSAITTAVGANCLAATDAHEIGRALAEALAGGRERECPERWDADASHERRRRSSEV